MRALVTRPGQSGFGTVVLLTAIVTFVGAAGMFAFERAPIGAPYFHGFSDAFWWTAMIMTPMGSAYWPQTGDGRLLCLGLVIYAFAVFGYVTATIASFFIDASPTKPAATTSAQVQALQSVQRALRLELRTGAAVSEASPPGHSGQTRSYSKGRMRSTSGRISSAASAMV